MPCPNDDTLLAMLEHSVDPVRFGELELHIDGCAHCRKAVAVLALGSRSPSAPHTPFAELEPGFASGATINDRYVVQSEIGRGGMGTVYVARDKSLGRDVALKIHRAGSTGDRLFREAQSMAKLAHPNVVNVFEVATIGDRMVVAMEYVRGTTLRGWLDGPASRPAISGAEGRRGSIDGPASRPAISGAEGRRGSIDGPASRPAISGAEGRRGSIDGRASRPAISGAEGRRGSIDGPASRPAISGAEGRRGSIEARPRRWREIVAMLVDAGRGLAAAHAAGLVHRDFKPENVLVGEDGRPRVGDFGLARTDHAPIDANPEVVATALTVTGGIAGTPAYMAPEQLAGDPVDARCDQFAFCVVAWECLFGRRPFAGGTLGALHLAIEEHRLDRPSGSEVPDRVRRAIERGLAAEPDARYADMTALLHELQRAAAPRTTRNAIATAVSAIAISAGAFATYHAVTERQHASACLRERDHVRTLFGDPVRAALQREFLATGSAVAPSSFDHTTSVLDRYTTALADEAGDVCRDRDEPERVIASRRACLSDRESELAALVDAFAHADAELVSRAPDAAWAVFDPIPCADAAQLPSSTLSADQATKLGQLTALTHTGRFREGVALGMPMLAEARAHKDQAFELAVLMTIGQQQAEIDRKVAVATFHDAETLAEAQGRDLDAAQAHNALANAAGVEQHDYALAHREVALARAKLARIGGNAAMESRLVMTEAQILYEENRLGDAAIAMQRGVIELEHVYGGDHLAVGSAYGTLSQILGAQGKYPEALVAAQRSFDVLERALGDQHPDVAGAELTLAQVLLAEKRVPEAADLLKRADAVFLATYGADHPMRAAIYGNLGQLEQDQGHYEASLVDYRTALGIIQRTQGPDAASVAGVEHDIANSLGALNRFDEAMVSAQHAVSILDKLGPDGENRLSNMLVVVAEIDVAREHPERALPVAERALAIATRRTADANPSDLADAQYLVARVLWDGHGDRARARKLAETAAKTPDPDKAAVIATWLKSHAL